MAGYDAVGTFTTYGQGSSFNMSDSCLEHSLVHTVVDGKEDLNGGNLHISHHPAARNVQQPLISADLLLCGVETVRMIQQFRIVGLGVTQ